MRSKPTPFGTAWWNASPDDRVAPLHQRVFTHCRALEADQADIHAQNLLNARLYTNRDLMNFQWQGASSISFRPLNTNLENIIQSVVDTLVSSIAKNRPKATPVARAADFDVYLRARQLDRYLWGEFLHQDIYTKGEEIFTDGCVYGTGLLKIEREDKDIYSERVNPDEIIVDQRECVSCRQPQQMHQRKLVSREWLLAEYGQDPDKKLSILKAQAKDFQYSTYRSPSDEQLIVIESWKLPYDEGITGRHAICIENCTLVDEGYTRGWFPFVEFRWNLPQSGWYGRSLVEDLTGYQIRLNELNEVIRVGQDIMCVPRVFLQQGGGIVKSQFDNAVGKIITVRGDLPTAQTWSAFNPEIYQERDRIRQAAFEFAGVSQLSSQAKLPSQARLDSSDALREFSNIEDERFSRQAQAYEKFYMDVALRIIQLSAELYRGKKSVDRSQFFRSKYLVQQINWSKVDMEADRYVLQISASSIMNMSPAARKDKLNELASSGAISMEQYRAWSGQPDLERLSDLMTAPHDYTEYVIDKLLDGDTEIMPDPMADLQLLFRTCHDTYLHLRSLETDENILQGFRDYLSATEKLLNPPPDAATAAAAQGNAPPGMPPPAPSPGLGGSPPGMPPMGPPPGPAMGAAVPVDPRTGVPDPSVSMPAAQAFLGQ